MDTLVPICYPDYEVDTETTFGRLPFGHAGILMIANSGLTKYYEYGRYDAAKKGLVRRVSIPNIAVGQDGSPELKNLGKVLHRLSTRAGHGGRIEGVYIRDKGIYIKASGHAAHREKENSKGNREAYSLWTRNCMTFVKDCLQAAAIDVPWMIDPRPHSYIDKLRESFPKLDCGPNGAYNVSITDPGPDTPFVGWSDGKVGNVLQSR